MNKELIEALDILEKEKNISKDTLLEAIENSLLTACKNHFGKADNVHVNINRETGDFAVYAEKTVVEEVEDPAEQIALEKAKMMDSRYEVGDIVNVPTRNGPGEAKVVAVDVPESELPAWLSVDKLQHITEPAIAGGMIEL